MLLQVKVFPTDGVEGNRRWSRARSGVRVYLQRRVGPRAASGGGALDDALPLFLRMAEGQMLKFLEFRDYFVIL